MKQLYWLALVLLVLSSSVAGATPRMPGGQSSSLYLPQRELGLTPDWILDGGQADARLGWSVNSAGDVNGDGYDDAIISSNWYSNGQVGEGRAYVFYGSSTGLRSTADWIGESNQAEAYYGNAVDSAGDVNGDGYDDVIVGAYFYSNGQYQEGRAYAYYGSAQGLSTTPNWMVESNQSEARLGIDVSSAGDVNGDGYDDVVVSAIWYANGQEREGRVWLYYGSAQGLSNTPAWMVEGNQYYAYMGYSIDSAGDVNGDGYGDVILGAWQYDNGQVDEGQAYVYYGSPAGLPPTPSWTVEGNQAGAGMGLAVGGAGDVNADGYDDVLVGAWEYDNGQSDEGRTFLYYGSPSGLSVNPAWTAEGNQSGARFGRPVSTAGDVNGDGYGDIAIGARFYDSSHADDGAVFVFYGSSVGPSSSADWMATGNQASATMGGVANAGDLNGDGWTDLIVGAHQYDNGQANEGQVYVYYSANSCTPVSNATMTWTPANPMIGEAVTFVGAAEGTAPLTYVWDLGDGTVAEGAIVTHAYTAAGSYTVVLQVNNACGQQTITQTVVVAEPCLPVANASFTWTPLEPAVGEPVTFVGTAEGTPPLSFAWDLGDGTIGGGETVTHPYAAPGQYTVALQVSNACGQQTVSQVVTVHEANPAELVNVDIKPGGCPNPFNPQDDGVVPVAVLGTLEFDITTIDPSTVRLEGVAPLRWDQEDVATPVWDRQDVCDCTEAGADGFLDLTFKFDAQELGKALPPTVAREGIVLTLTGTRWDGTPIEGQDCVVLVPMSADSADGMRFQLPIVP